MKNLIIILALIPTTLFAQENLLDELNSQSKETDYAFATFKSTRLGNGHTVETRSKNTLDFIFQHRFGSVEDGAYNLFGLDEASVRLALDYGITDKLSVSIGRNSVDKTMDGFLKYKLLRQSKGVRNFPITVTALANAAYRISPKGSASTDRMSYTYQLLIARKFSPGFSFQIMPTYVHKNAINTDAELANQDQFALGFGGRLKVTRSIALTAEYYANFNLGQYNFGGEFLPYHNSLCFGIDIETGGHVFQLLLTNAIGLNERAFITETEDDFFSGSIHLGFNVSRTFELKKKK
ncbi:MAG TPA: DUF5777 family beta-barrel protein [Chryseolinea sp.]|nr:DUF5777 family beta-barrel protein [Chryseolinea sp.]